MYVCVYECTCLLLLFNHLGGINTYLKIIVVVLVLVTNSYWLFALFLLLLVITITRWPFFAVFLFHLCLIIYFCSCKNDAAPSVSISLCPFFSYYCSKCDSCNWTWFTKKLKKNDFFFCYCKRLSIFVISAFLFFLSFPLLLMLLLLF